MKLLTDNPILKRDEDTFQFYPFVEILGKAIIETQSLPFTVGISGEWGSGKTSLLKLLNGWIKEKNCRSVWFNPWKYDKKEELWTAMIRSILISIYNEDSAR